MRLLVIGNGGREHTLVWKLKQSPLVEEIFVAPGNGGMESFATCINLNPTDIDELQDFAMQAEIDMTIVGPEIPLIAGIVDRFQEAGLTIIGPNQAAAQIEGSKRFAKELMEKYQIPTARYRAFTDANKAKDYIKIIGAPIVIKADGLAAGKGVIVAQTVTEAEEAIHDVMEKRIFGEAGNEVVIEEFLVGQEASLMAFVDSSGIQPMVISQDHKPVYDGDQGPNTGGMGTYSPVPQIPSQIVEQAIEEILKPTIAGLKKEGIQFQGILYAGLMITATGPKVIEFNARFGDPETQVVLPRLKTDLLEVFKAMSENRVADLSLDWNEQAAVCVVMTSGGYPEDYENGKVITGLSSSVQSDQSMIFHAGTKRSETGKVVTNGGRVLGVTALGEDLASAREQAYQLVEQIHFEGAHYRTDIANKALK
ncbi:phosphoribosylamine--glycine ligase [Seinonella peptonophila]|uniref:Phosphoribosylamine--glycine ligase n=1 Tax=Seinonella peptonophila TaxID=112248 RepID=A0A1M4ZHB3_9BACL|nr:phosphoribosylamine--glycine ligase [Seinonella peptonophila]SHF17429.1 phosphoribosylamine--glycine ligase [Seinonella peptonophila]